MLYKNSLCSFEYLVLFAARMKQIQEQMMVYQGFLISRSDNDGKKVIVDKLSKIIELQNELIEYLEINNSGVLHSEPIEGSVSTPKKEI